MLTIDILRHGETTAAQGRLYGATDVALSALGQAQLLQALAAIQVEPIDHVRTSPLQRCAWLANQHSKTSPCPVTHHASFAEMNFGDWEGQDSQCLLEQGVDFRNHIGALHPPHGETFAAFSQRVRQAWHDDVAQYSEAGGHHLLITHGGVMRVLLGMVLHIPDDHLGKLYIPHATWSRVTCVVGEPPVLWFMNRHA